MVVSFSGLRNLAQAALSGGCTPSGPGFPGGGRAEANDTPLDITLQEDLPPSTSFDPDADGADAVDMEIDPIPADADPETAVPPLPAASPFAGDFFIASAIPCEPGSACAQQDDMISDLDYLPKTGQAYLISSSFSGPINSLYRYDPKTHDVKPMAELSFINEQGLVTKIRPSKLAIHSENQFLISGDLMVSDAAGNLLSTRAGYAQVDLTLDKNGNAIASDIKAISYPTVDKSGQIYLTPSEEPTLIDPSQANGIDLAAGRVCSVSSQVYYTPETGELSYKAGMAWCGGFTAVAPLQAMPTSQLNSNSLAATTINGQERLVAVNSGSSAETRWWEPQTDGSLDVFDPLSGAREWSLALLSGAGMGGEIATIVVNGETLVSFGSANGKVYVVNVSQPDQPFAAVSVGADQDFITRTAFIQGGKFLVVGNSTSGELVVYKLDHDQFVPPTGQGPGANGEPPPVDSLVVDDNLEDWKGINDIVVVPEADGSESLRVSVGPWITSVPLQAAE